MNSSQDNWDEHLSAVLFAYQTGVQKATKLTPFEIIFFGLTFKALTTHALPSLPHLPHHYHYPITILPRPSYHFLPMIICPYLRSPNYVALHYRHHPLTTPSPPHHHPYAGTLLLFHELPCAFIQKEATQSNVLTVRAMPVQQQTGGVDCGLFAIAFAYWENLGEVTFERKIFIYIWCTILSRTAKNHFFHSTEPLQ